MAEYQAIIIAVITGGISSIATIAAVKVDMSWVKMSQKEQKQEINELEKRTRTVEIKLQGLKDKS
ncbi:MULTISPECIES: hypothetical protein [unclassified Vibrio]|uniref:hypothetical protein n=1 Tax=unclassified Vibrio TaxID=2614977 RepID=UPI000C8331BD|nr:hypothetical protein [Vibrio sp. 10N.261.54.E10]PMK09639.1 hypothetical protein BCU07_15185 [Vibrio sp. 10N.261.54.E10]